MSAAQAQYLAWVKDAVERSDRIWMESNAFNNAIRNHNPKRDRAHAIAAEVRARRPEMQVHRLTVPLNDVN